MSTCIYECEICNKIVQKNGEPYGVNTYYCQECFKKMKQCDLCDFESTESKTIKIGNFNVIESHIECVKKAKRVNLPQK